MISQQRPSASGMLKPWRSMLDPFMTHGELLECSVSDLSSQAVSKQHFCTSNCGSSNCIGLVTDDTCTVSCKPNNDGEPTILSCMSDTYIQGDLLVCQPAASLHSIPICRGVIHDCNENVIGSACNFILRCRLQTC